MRLIHSEAAAKLVFDQHSEIIVNVNALLIRQQARLGQA
jgi:hypothetical protein